jgi:hypothetical protein
MQNKIDKINTFFFCKKIISGKQIENSIIADKKVITGK